MNSTLTIARRELVEKRFIFVTAAAFLALALIVPFMPGVHEGERIGALLIGSLTLATALSVGLSAILGTSIVGRDLADGRLSFYFSKPVPSLSIWFGKLIAAAILIFGSFVIVGFPALLAGGAAAMNTWTGRTADSFSVIEGILIAAGALFLLCHVIGTFVRSRSVWIVFDFVAAIVCGAAIWLLGRQLLTGLAVRLTTRLGWIFAAFAAVAIVAAGGWQIARGRTDRKRSHIELSRFLWMSLGCGLLAIAAFVIWVVSPAPPDLIADSATQSPDSWAFIGGPARNRMDYRASFLYNIDTGRYARIGSQLPWWGASFSSDGKVAYWMVPSIGTYDLWIARLDTPDPQPMQTKISVGSARSFNISPEGSRFAVFDFRGLLSVYEIASGDLIGSARIPAGDYWGVYFATPDVVRVLANTRQLPTKIFEYDLRRKSLTATGEVPPGGYRLNVEHTSMVHASKDALEIRDARTGALLHAIPGNFGTARYMRDGRIAAFGGVLRVFSSDGAPLREIAVPKGMPESIVDAGGGRVVLVLRGARCIVIDIDRGVVVRSEDGIRPASFNSSNSRLLCYTREGLVLWDPATGGKKRISASS